MAEKYDVKMTNFSQLENEVTVPKFQRRLVWTKREKKEFIETLHNGYPFGSILIYEYDEDKGKDRKYTLIDGLQRYSTIMEFKKDPQEYVDFTNSIEDITNILAKKEEIAASTKKKLSYDIERIIIEMVKDKRNKNDPLYLSSRIEELVKQLGISIDNEDLMSIIKIQPEIFIEVEGYLNIDNIQVPTIIFLGNESELAVVFENLNKGGKKLSKYQVFAAQWSNTEIQLKKEKYSLKILNKVIERYNRLNDSREVEIEDFDEIDMKEKATINLPEFCYGLGQLILETMYVFWDTENTDLDKNEDLANTIGYSTVALVLDVELRSLHKIIDKKEVFSNSYLIEDMVEKIIEEYNFINSYFSNYLRYPGKNKERYESSITTNYQILSFFITLWSIKYKSIDYDEIKIREQKEIQKNSRYSRRYKLAKENFIKYYIHDLYSGYWSGTGDAKVDKIKANKGERYVNDLSFNTLENTLNNWWIDKQQNPRINFDQHSKSLLVIYTNYNKSDYSELDYELEHVFPRKKLRKIYKEGKGVPAGTLGNMMFLEKGENRSIQEFSLYDVVKESSILDKDFIDKKYYPSREEFIEVEKEIMEKDYGFSRLREIIDKRGKDIINNLLYKIYEH